jgi:hypothetical protein
MQTIVLALVASLFLSQLSQLSQSPPGQITALDRQRLLAHMEMTSKWLADEVSSLSQAQLEFRRAPGTWSVLENLDHLVVVGPIYWEDLQRGVKGKPPALPLPSRDVDILWYGIDRGRPETALATETPKGGIRDVRAGLDAYRKNHARLLEYIRTTKDDLRNLVVERQGCDAYQWALLISTHEQRHILQIREIKADPKFPAK